MNASKLLITKTQSPKPKTENKDLVFGHTFSDHMLTVEWTKKSGWGIPHIKPYSNIKLDPSASVFHYAFECFEGLKAYKDSQDNIRLFRPDKNMTRMNLSAERICLPSFNSDEAIKLIKQLLIIDKDWIPQGKGYSMYLRPTLIGTNAALGVGVPDRALFFVIMSPVGPYYPTGFKAVSLEATDYAVRAWPGGVGNRKIGANYAPCVMPQQQAASKGYQQNLWLFGEEGYVTEVGTMNAFFVFKKADKKELVTAPLDGTILDGVTRDSILSLAHDRLPSDKWEISERYCTIQELANAANVNNLIEAFGSGTAAVVSPIKEIGWHGKSIKIPLPKDKEAGELTETIAKWITDIQYGVEEHPWSVVI